MIKEAVLANEPLAPAENGAHRLRGRMGTIGLTFTILSFAAPLLAMSGTAPIVISAGNGLGAPSAFLVACALLVVFAVGFTAMTRRVARPGGFYSYVSASLGRPVGLGTSFLSMFGYFGLLMGTYPLFGQAVTMLLQAWFGIEITWWVWAGLSIILVGIIAHLEINVSAHVLSVLLVLEILIVVVFDVATLAQGGDAGLSPVPYTYEAFVQGSVGTALMFTILTFTGFEATAIYRDEVKNPAKTITRATYLALIFMGVFYSITTYTMIIAWGVDDAVDAATNDPASMLPLVMTRYVGPILADIQVVLLVTSGLAALISIHNTLTRYFHSLGSDEILPKKMGAVHARHGSPYVASMVTTVVSLVVLVFFIVAGASYVQVYSWLLGVGTYALLPVYALMSVSVIVFFRRHPEFRGRLLATVVAPAVSFVGLIATFAIATGSLPDLIGNSLFVAILSEAGLLALFLGGIIWALILRRNKPSLYEKIGRNTGEAVTSENEQTSNSLTREST